MKKMAKIYTYYQVVQPEEIDDLDHVNNLVYLQWAQKVSGLHWLEMADKNQLDNSLWVISRQEANYFKELRVRDEIQIETFVDKVEKQKCYRQINIYALNPKRLVEEVKIVWVLLGINKKPQRISEALAKLFLTG